MTTPSPQDPSTSMGIAVSIAELRVELREAVRDIRDQRDDFRTQFGSLQGELKAEIRSVRERHSSDMTAVYAKQAADMATVNKRFTPLEASALRRQGVVLTGKSAAAIIGVAVSLLTIVVLLIALLTGAPQ